MSNVVAFRKRTVPARAALEHLRRIADADGVLQVKTIADVATLLGWGKDRTWKAVGRWKKAGRITVEETADGLRIRILPDRRPLAKGAGTGVKALPKGGRRKSKNTGSIEPISPSDGGTEAPQDTAIAVSSALDKQTGQKRSRRRTRGLDIVARNIVAATTYASRENSEQAVNTAAPESGNTSVPPAAMPPIGALPAENTSISDAVELGKIAHPDTAAGGAGKSAPAAERTASDVATPAAPSQSKGAVTDATVRPVARRGGGGGGGGFDVAETFGRASGPEKLLIMIAAGLSGTAAFMSVMGMTVLYPLEPTTIMVFGGLIEAAKFCGFAIVIGGWRNYSGIGKWAALVLLIVAAVINASGVYGKLIANHTTTAAGRTAAFAEADAGQGAKLEVASGRLSDIDRRIALIDGASEGAARRGRSASALRAIEQQRRQRASLVSERQGAATRGSQPARRPYEPLRAPPGGRGRGDAGPLCRCAVRRRRHHRAWHGSREADAVAFVLAAAVRRSAGACAHGRD